ncbi:hypothetical protein GCM10010441_45310 [Kitasatospora paracochleata]|uniref:Uncharacterized protein n=1 Tax=Kitasatospora paracochleata TaxID=58354 RepID=A0ABT1J9I0_9ACTN|nr:hypothetical protein [Kitasatospora paracochleata]MCP2314109.1 hypothetical protein [Kitasatospora paracochleata]
MELDQALEPLRRVLLERGTAGYPETVATAVEAARTALAGGADTPSLWELGVLPVWDALEARRLLAELEQELRPVLRLPATSEACNWALARYCLQDLLDGGLDPLVAAERVGFALCPADDPGSPLWPVRGWLHLAEDQQEHCGGLTKELVAELHDLALRLLAGPLS